MNNETMVENQVVTPTTQEQVQPENQSGNVASNMSANNQKEKMYTKAQITEIMKRRVERSHKSFFNRYGVQDLQGLDDLFSKNRSYDEMEANYGALQIKNSELEQKIAFLENSIEPNRYADIKAYFKGNDLAFSNEALIEALKTHPEWLKQDGQPKTTITAMGVNQDEQNHKRDSEKEIASRYFGVNL